MFIYYKKYLLLCSVISIILFGNVTLVSASNIAIAGSGCFARVSDDVNNVYTVRMQTPSCAVTVNNTASTNQTVNITIENIDPDFVTVDKYDVIPGLTKTTNTLQFLYTVAAGSTTINITPWQTITNDFYFVALSDNQPSGTIEVNPAFTQMLQQVSTVNPVFFTNSGDLVSGSEDTATLQAMFTALHSELASYATAPIYTVPGNHDYGTDLSIYKTYFGGTIDYTFDFANTKFVNFSTASPVAKGDVTSEQLTWLNTTLAGNTKTNLIALFHHPVSTPSWGSSTCCYTNTTTRNELAGVLDNNQIDYAINGHTHGYDYRWLTSTDVSTINNGFYQLITAGAGGSLTQPDGQYHFMLMHVLNDAITPTFIALNDFATTVNYTDNTGTTAIATAQVKNTAATALPYVRLKFKVSNQYTNYQVYDNASWQYRTPSCKAFTDYTVCYLDTTAPAQSDFTYTITASVQLYRAAVNTVQADGTVTVNPTPASAENVVTGLTVLPATQSTQVSDIVWGGAAEHYQRTWLETPRVANLATTYTISELPAQQTFAVTVNNKLIDKITTDTAGVLTFTYNEENASRQFKLIWLDDAVYPEKVFLTPDSGGQPQVRVFDGAGKNLTNWYALTSSTSGSYRTVLGDVTGDDIDEVIVYTGKGIMAQVGAYTQDGAKLASVIPYGESFTKGLQVQVADITGDGVAELIMSPQSGKGELKVFGYDATTATLIKLSGYTFYSTAFKKPVRWLTGNWNNDNVAELVVVGSNKKGTKVRLYRYDTATQQWALVNKKILTDFYTNLAIAKGDVLGVGSTQLLIYGLNQTLAEPQEQLIVFKNRGGKLKLVNRYSLTTKLTGQVRMASGNVFNELNDSVLFWSKQNNYLVGFSLQEQKLKKRFKKYPYSQDATNSFNFNLLDTNHDGQVELVIAPMASAAPKVKILNYDTSANQWLKTSWLGYPSNFLGGVYIGNK
jgi:hypothetical protein